MQLISTLFSIVAPTALLLLIAFFIQITATYYTIKRYISQSNWSQKQHTWLRYEFSSKNAHALLKSTKFPFVWEAKVTCKQCDDNHTYVTRGYWWNMRYEFFSKLDEFPASKPAPQKTDFFVI